MPMGIVSDDDFLKESNSLGIHLPKPEKPKAEILEIEKNEKGRGKGNVEVPNSLRNLIADTSVNDGRGEALALAKQFGISPSSTSAYTNGSTSTSSYDEKPNKEIVLNAKERLSKKARIRLSKALDQITTDKLAVVKTREAASIAKDMSVIIKNLEEKNETNTPQGQQGPTFVFYSPQVRTEESFKTIQVKE